MEFRSLREVRFDASKRKVEGTVVCVKGEGTERNHEAEPWVEHLLVCTSLLELRMVDDAMCDTVFPIDLYGLQNSCVSSMLAFDRVAKLK